MAKHRHPHEEPPSLLPATVEELAAGERARPPLSIKRHAILAATVASLLLAGATSWALTRPDGLPGDDSSRGLGPDAVASAGALEGFGPASPLASRSAVSSSRPSVRTTTSSAPSPSAATSGATPTRSVTTTVTALDASYVMLTWQGGYQVTVVVTNPSAAPVLWKLRVQLPSNAQFSLQWSAELARDGAVLTFTPPKWDNGNPRPLAPGTTHTFGFIALQPSGDYRLLSCAVDGVPCRAINP